MNIAEFIEQGFQDHPGKMCVIQNQVRRTYADVKDRSDRLALSLQAMGVKKGDRVGIFATNCPEFLEIFSAVIKVGAIFVSLNYRLKEKETSYILNDAEPVVLILSERYVPLIESIRKDLPVRAYIVLGTADSMDSYDAVLAASSPAEPSARFPVVKTADDDCFGILYTSGTTGVPKGAMLTHGNLIDALTPRDGAPPARVSGTLLINVPMYHIAGVLAPLSMMRGETTVILDRFDPGEFLEVVEREKIATTYLVPTMLRAILDHPDFDSHDLSSLRNIDYGAAPMPHQLILRAISKLPVNYTNTFGQTESLGTITSLTPDDHTLAGTEEEISRKIHRLSGVGRAIAGFEVKVVDEKGDEVPRGEVGEFVARGKRVMRGYWKKAEATRETLLDGFLHTGDLVYMDEDDYLYLAGRKKDMINRAGENIYPVELEEMLHSHEAILESAVIGVADDYWGEIVKAYVVLQPGAQLTAEDVIEYCRHNLASYKKPDVVEFVSSLPRNALGKVLKNDLREPV